MCSPTRDLNFPEDQIVAKSASIMKIYDKKSTGQLDKLAFVKLYAHFKEKESARLALFYQDLAAIEVTEVSV